MLTLLLLVPVLLFALVVTRALRFLAAIFNPAPCRFNPYRYGCRRHHGLLGSLLPVVALVALDRLLDLRR